MLNKLAKEIHALAVSKGWWDNEPSFGEIIALIHSEVSEALEEYRNGAEFLYCTELSNCKNVDNNCAMCFQMDIAKENGVKPVGIAIELADAIIRILDYCGRMDIDIDEAIRIKHEYNKTRPWRHNGKVL